jgi:hypothetical protein
MLRTAPGMGCSVKDAATMGYGPRRNRLHERRGTSWRRPPPDHSLSSIARADAPELSGRAAPGEQNSEPAQRSGSCGEPCRSLVRRRTHSQHPAGAAPRTSKHVATTRPSSAKETLVASLDDGSVRESQAAASPRLSMMRGFSIGVLRFVALAVAPPAVASAPTVVAAAAVNCSDFSTPGCGLGLLPVARRSGERPGGAGCGLRRHRLRVAYGELHAAVEQFAVREAWLARFEKG